MHIGTLSISKGIALTQQEKLNSIEIVKSELSAIVSMCENISPENQELMFSNIIAAFLVLSQKLVMMGMPSSENDEVADNYTATLDRFSEFLENGFDIDLIKESAVFLNNIKINLQPSEINHMRFFSGPYADKFIRESDLKLEILKGYCEASSTLSKTEYSFKEMQVVDSLKSPKKIEAESSIKKENQFHKNKFSLRDLINSIGAKKALLILGIGVAIAAIILAGPVIVTKLAIITFLIANPGILILIFLLLLAMAMFAFILRFAEDITKSKGYPMVKYWVDQFLSAIQSLSGIKFKDND